jgi:hypothetical protein
MSAGNADDVIDTLRQQGIHLGRGAQGRHYTTCPECSPKRKAEHQRRPVLGVTVERDSAHWGCNHCGWTGAVGKADGRAPLITYDYVDEDGGLLFQKVRNIPGREPRFWLRRPDGRGDWIKGRDKAHGNIIYRLPQVLKAIADGRPIVTVEGEKDADNLWKIGIPATCNPDGASEPDNKPKWRREHSKWLSGADIVVTGDNDDPGRAHIQATASTSAGIAKRIRVLDPKCWHVPPKLSGREPGKDVSDWLGAGHLRDELNALIGAAPDWRPVEMSAVPVIVPEITIDEVVKTFTKWLKLDSTTVIYAVLGATAANLLQGDPVWLGIIAAPSSAKTEILNSISKLPFIRMAATLTPPGLLSGTSKRQKRKEATGGLLREIGEFGILVFKDFTTVLAMRPDSKAEILAALREIYDGSWRRNLGTDGGITLEWQGKCGFLFACTQEYDRHYGVISSLGDRFLLSRMKTDDGNLLKKSLSHTGAETVQMRKELAAAVTGLFVARGLIRDKLHEPACLDDCELDRLDKVCRLAVRLRATVVRDYRTKEIEQVYDPEGTPRIGLALERLIGGLVALGVDRKQSLHIAEEIALDSTPPNRKRAFELLNAAPITTRRVAEIMKLPTVTVRRALEELTAQGLAEREGEIGVADKWTVSRDWAYWAEHWRTTNHPRPSLQEKREPYPENL